MCGDYVIQFCPTVVCLRMTIDYDRKPNYPRYRTDLTGAVNRVRWLYIDRAERSSIAVIIAPNNYALDRWRSTLWLMGWPVGALAFRRLK
jgi:hypothetical protein